ncbi:MAG: twin-arginine translocase subunit TatC [Bacteroidia bacterium]|nr:twin-arginine translocase subunit TatC [Bacteroidia bacterium]
MSFFDHVDDLRKHLFRAVVAILVGTIAAFIQKSFIFDTLIFGPKRTDFWTYRMLCELSHKIYHDDTMCLSDIGFVVSNITMSGQFTQHMFVAFIAGVILAFPFILLEVWKFIRPALKKSERNKVRGIVFYSSILFFIGILFGYYFLTPVSLSFLGSYRVSEEVINEINLESYIDFVATLTLATGIVFELPIVVFFLAKLGVMSAAFMKKYRRHAFLIILIIAAIVTPPDVTSQILMTIPLYGLYEFSIVIANRVEKGKKAA